MMIDRTTDAEAREQALDIAGSFIVQAPAGSGKTELLTQRYLHLLGHVNHPEEIYAITFTRKAAAEMRSRVVLALQAAAMPEPSEPHKRLTWSLARAVVQRDVALDWQLQRNPNRLRIQTFDSLSHALARQMPVMSELGAPPTTTDRPDAHYQSAARATLRQLDSAELGPDIAQLLLHLDNRQAQLETLICAMLARRDQWLGHTLKAPGAHDIERALESAVTEHLERLLENGRADLLQQLYLLAGQAAQQLLQTVGDTGTLTPWAGREDSPLASWDDLPAWQALAGLLLTKDGKPRRSWDKRSGFPAPGEKGIGAEQKQQRQAAKQAIKALTAEITDDSESLLLWQGLAILPRQGLNAQQEKILGSLFRVLLHAAIELKLVFAETGEVDFAEIQIRAQTALGTPEHPSDLALSLDYRLQHLLIDEFQDTSSSQYYLLETLTAGWQHDDGRTLFAVGDPMQSIYRFREAEVGLYLSAREQGLGNLALTPLTLNVNFRSTGGIVDWINQSFVHILPAQVDVSRGAVPYAAAVAFDTKADTDAVQVHPFAGSDHIAEANAVVALIKTALTESPDGQIAVLARARSHLRDIAMSLREAGLRFQAVDIDPLSQQPVVRDLYALTRALLHPGDRLAWLTLLRTPWIGLEMDDLLAIAGQRGRSIPGRLANPRVLEILSEDGRARITRLLGTIAPQLPARGRQPLRPWIERQWRLLGGWAAAGDREADADAFLQLLEQHESAAGVMDFGQLDEAIGRLYASPDSRADGRIQLMTMHKSKGLEFDTVILPGLGRAPRGRDSELLYWLERPSRSGGTQLLMAPIRSSDEVDEPISDYLRQLDKEKDELESARLLYVAATRARRRLHLLGHLGYSDKGMSAKPGSSTLLAKLWCVVENDYASLSPPQTPSPADQLADIPLKTLRRLPADWQPDISAINAASPQKAVDDRATTIEFAWAGDTARHVGTLVHRQLERIANDGIERWHAERANELETRLRLGFNNLGVPAEDIDSATAKALRALRNTLEDETGRWILADHPEAVSEWPLTLNGEEIRHYVIDRSFIDDEGTRWIIDYKTGEHLDGDRDTFLDQEQARYREQLENYGRILHRLEGRPIRLALYFPLFSDWRVWAFQPDEATNA